jgi:hypothetical protein
LDFGFCVGRLFSQSFIMARARNSASSRDPNTCKQRFPGVVQKAPIYLGIVREHEILPLKESCDRFGSWEEASQAGKKALQSIAEETH